MSEGTYRRIAAAVLQRPDGRVLLLKRAPTHTTNPGRWCFVTGYVEAGEQPRETAVRELSEELGITGTPVREGALVEVHTESGTILHVYPFLFAVEDIPVSLEREHVDYRWIDPGEIYAYDIVQQLDDDLIALGLLPPHQRGQ